MRALDVCKCLSEWINAAFICDVLWRVQKHYSVIHVVHYIFTLFCCQVRWCAPCCTANATLPASACRQARSTHSSITITHIGPSPCCCWRRCPGTSVSTSTPSRSPARTRRTNPVSAYYVITQTIIVKTALRNVVYRSDFLSRTLDNKMLLFPCFPGYIKKKWCNSA